MRGNDKSATQGVGPGQKEAKKPRAGKEALLDEALAKVTPGKLRVKTHNYA